MKCPEYNSSDICSAYRQIETDYNKGGVLWERKSNKRRRESTAVQLHRIGYKAAHGQPLTPNGKAIYRLLQARYGFLRPEVGVDIEYRHISYGSACSTGFLQTYSSVDDAHGTFARMTLEHHSGYRDDGTDIKRGTLQFGRAVEKGKGSPLYHSQKELAPHEYAMLYWYANIGDSLTHVFRTCALTYALHRLDKAHLDWQVKNGVGA